MDPPGYEDRAAVMVERMGRMLQGDLRRALCRLASNKIHLEQDG